MAEQTPKQSLLIEGLKWFDSINGNTYYSAKAYLNGKLVLTVPMAYGYSDQYMYDTVDQLEANGTIPTQHDYKAKTWHLRDLYDFTYRADCVPNESDLNQ